MFAERVVGVDAEKHRAVEGEGEPRPVEEAAVWEDGDYDWVLREEDGGHGRHLGMRYK